LDAAARARVPKAARAHSPEGAEAFARFYLEQVNEAWMKPDPELIRPYALESCKTCANYVATAEWLLSREFHYDGRPMRLGEPIVAPESESDHYFIELIANQENRNIISHDGKVEEVVAYRAAGAQVELGWHGTSWVVREVRVIL
jgi:hypothetical protein